MLSAYLLTTISLILLLLDAGLAASDWPEPWRKIRIPVVLVLSHQGALLEQATEPYKDKISTLLRRSEAGRDEL